MPSVNNTVSPMELDIKEKTCAISNMLLRAWRERWTDAQWGINIKSVNITIGIIIIQIKQH